MRNVASTTRNALRMIALLSVLALSLAGCKGAAPTGRTARPTPADDAALLAQALPLIERFEGRLDRAYDDGFGNLTVGVGFNLDRGNARETLAAVAPEVDYQALRAGRIALTDAQIDALLRHDAEQALASARQYVGNFDELPLEARLILIDMSFNLGSIAGWPDLRAALAASDFHTAAREMADSAWREQTGRRANHLIHAMRTLADRV